MSPWCAEGSGHSCQNGEVLCGFQLPCKLVLGLLEEQGFAVSVSVFSVSVSWCFSDLSVCIRVFLSFSLNLRFPASFCLRLAQLYFQQHCNRTASDAFEFKSLRMLNFSACRIHHSKNFQNQLKRLSEIPFIIGNYLFLSMQIFPLFHLNNPIWPYILLFAFFLYSLLTHKPLNIGSSSVFIVLIRAH